MLPPEKLVNFVYVVNKSVIEKNLKVLNINYQIKNNHLSLSNNHKIPCYFIDSTEESSSLTSLEHCLNSLEDEDILVTSPTTKDKFKNNEKQLLGHAGIPSQLLPKKNLTMNFINNKEQVLILTDHVPIKEIVNKLSVETIIEQIKASLNGLNLYFQRVIDTVLISGINPHAGE